MICMTIAITARHRDRVIGHVNVNWTKHEILTLQVRRHSMEKWNRCKDCLCFSTLSNIIKLPRNLSCLNMFISIGTTFKIRTDIDLYFITFNVGFDSLLGLYILWSMFVQASMFWSSVTPFTHLCWTWVFIPLSLVDLAIIFHTNNW